MSPNVTKVEKCVFIIIHIIATHLEMKNIHVGNVHLQEKRADNLCYEALTCHEKF